MSNLSEIRVGDESLTATEFSGMIDGIANIAEESFVVEAILVRRVSSEDDSYRDVKYLFRSGEIHVIESQDIDEGLYIRV